MGPESLKSTRSIVEFSKKIVFWTNTCVTHFLPNFPFWPPIPCKHQNRFSDALWGIKREHCKKNGSKWIKHTTSGMKAKRWLTTRKEINLWQYQPYLRRKSSIFYEKFFFFKFRGTYFFMLRLCWALYWNYVKALKEIIVKFVNHGLEDSGHIKVRCERLILTFRNNFKEIIWTGNKGLWFTKRNKNIKIQ